MPDSVEFKLEGFDQLKAKLNSLEQDVKKKGGRFALRKAANIVADSVKQNARGIDDPGTEEKIADNVAIRWSGRRFKRTGDLMFRVGILGGARATGKAKRKTERRRARLGQTSLADLGEIEGRGKDNPGGDTFYWRFVEFGTEKTPARPFLRPALERNVTKATNEFVKQYGKSIDRAIKRAAK